MLDAFGNLESCGRPTYELADQVREPAPPARHADRRAAAAAARAGPAPLRARGAGRGGPEAGRAGRAGRERERLAHAQALQAFAAGGCARLYDEEGSVVELLGKLQREAAGLGRARPGAGRRRAAGWRAWPSEAQDVAETLRDLAERWEADPGRREEVEERLQLLAPAGGEVRPAASTS